MGEIHAWLSEVCVLAADSRCSTKAGQGGGARFGGADTGSRSLVGPGTQRPVVAQMSAPGEFSSSVGPSLTWGPRATAPVVRPPPEH